MMGNGYDRGEGCKPDARVERGGRGKERGERGEGSKKFAARADQALTARETNAH